MNILIGITGASGVAFGVALLRRCPHPADLVVSRWGRTVLREECGMDMEELRPLARRVFADGALAAPYASGSEPFDAMVILPCTTSTLAKIAAGIGDTLITRAAAVALKERRRLILGIRETPWSHITVDNALKVSLAGGIIMPVSPPFYTGARSVQDLAGVFADRVLALVGVELPEASRWAPSLDPKGGSGDPPLHAR